MEGRARAPAQGPFLEDPVDLGMCAQVWFSLICKSRHEPIGVRGCLSLCCYILGRHERTKEEQHMKDAPYVPLFPVMFSYVAYAGLDPYVLLFSNAFQMLDFGILVRFS